jgi:serine/threonine-protein kinase
MEGGRLGPYRLVSVLGTGGMGTVWKAVVVDPVAGLAPGTAVAVKRIHPHLLGKSGFVERFLREARIGQEVRHENLVRTHDAGTDGTDSSTTPYLAMELVEGQTLRDLVAEIGKAPEDLCRHVAGEVAKALRAVHAAGIVHRDLKPENVLVTRNEVVKLMDLGVAHWKEEALRLSQTGQFVGSVLYAAPEQFDSSLEIDGRADLYALGLLLHEIATGKHPFREDEVAKTIRRQVTETPRPLGEFDPQITPFFEEVVATLLEKDRDRRFPDATALVEALEGGEASAWWQARSEEIRARTRRPLRRVRVPGRPRSTDARPRSRRFARRGSGPAPERAASCS